MGEFRRDPILGQWVVVQTEDSLHPRDYEKEDNAIKHWATCQFCPGKEFLTPPEVDALRDPETQANKPGWKVRVVSNKFPALRIEGNIDYRSLGIFEMSNGIGAHEVLIETPDHDKQLADLSEDEVVNVLKKYKSRLLDLTGDKRFKYVIIFKNFGESAGATVEHAHSQIIALPMVPKYVLEELEGTKHYYDNNSRCVFCDMLKQEYEDKERIISQNDDFVSFCPFVPRYPFECWIFPKKHSFDFAHISEKKERALGRILKDVLGRIKTCLSNPAYNFYLHISPINYESQESYHWHIEIVPKLTRVSGFEWGTGLYVVQTDPSLAAQYLRETKKN